MPSCAGRERTYRSLSWLYNISWEALSRSAFVRARLYIYTHTHAYTRVLHEPVDRCVHSIERSLGVATTRTGKMVGYVF